MKWGVFFGVSFAGMLWFLLDFVVLVFFLWCVCFAVGKGIV